MKYFLFFIACLILYTGEHKACSQELHTATGNQLISNQLFTRFTSKDGLPDNRIRSIFQDKKGFLWIGTMNGVSKYDGYTFKKYSNTRDTNSMSGSWTHAICGDSLLAKHVQICDNG